MIQSLAQHLDPSPNRGNSTRGHLMVSAICSFKGSQSKRTRGPEPRSPVVGFTAQRQAWGTDGVWRNGGGPHDGWLLLPQRLYTCWREGGTVLGQGQGGGGV